MNSSDSLGRPSSLRGLFRHMLKMDLLRTFGSYCSEECLSQDLKGIQLVEYTSHDLLSKIRLLLRLVLIGSLSLIIPPKLCGGPDQRQIKSSFCLVSQTSFPGSFSGVLCGSRAWLHESSSWLSFEGSCGFPKRSQKGPKEVISVMVSWVMSAKSLFRNNHLPNCSSSELL